MHLSKCETFKVVVQHYRVLRWPSTDAEEEDIWDCKTAWCVYHHLSHSHWYESPDLAKPWTVLGKVSRAQVVHRALMIFGCYNSLFPIRSSILGAEDGNQAGQHLTFNFSLIACNGNAAPFLSSWWDFNFFGFQTCIACAWTVGACWKKWILAETRCILKLGFGS